MDSMLAQCINDGCSVALIVRLLVLRLHTVYRVFCLFLISDAASSSITLFEKVVQDPRLDYRITWIAMRIVGWILSLWMVYALLDAILHNLPGILRFSRKLLNITGLVALAVALSTARVEYLISGYSKYKDPVDRALMIGVVLERVMLSTALLMLLGILCFVLWFPVRMPRNLAIFSVGFVLFFAVGTVLLLLQSLWSHEILQQVSTTLALLLSACYVCWAIFINTEGEKVPVRLGHSWHPAEQKRLIGQLEALNEALLRASQKKLSRVS